MVDWFHLTVLQVKNCGVLCCWSWSEVSVVVKMCSRSIVFAWFSQKSQMEEDASLLLPPVAHHNLPSVYNALSMYLATSSRGEVNSRPGAQSVWGVVKSQATTINLHHNLPRPFQCTTEYTLLLWWSKIKQNFSCELQFSWWFMMLPMIYYVMDRQRCFQQDFSF